MKKKLKTCSVFGTLYTRQRGGLKRFMEKYPNKVEETLIQLLEEGYRHFICGANLGLELAFAEFVGRYKKEYPDIYLEIVRYHDEYLPAPWRDEELLQFLVPWRLTDRATCLKRDKGIRGFSRKTRYIVRKGDLVVGFYVKKDEPYCSLIALRAKKRRKPIRWIALSEPAKN